MKQKIEHLHASAPAWRVSPDRLAGLVFVVVVHCALLYGLMSQRLLPTPQDAATLFVDFIAPPQKKIETPKPPAPPVIKPVEKPQSRQLVAAAAVLAPSEYVAPPAPAHPEPVVETRPVLMPLPVAGPVSLDSELSPACHERPAPAYPSMSRRLGETGVVLVRVELSESGNVTSAKVDRSSGFPRLDEAAVSAVRQWRCTAPTRNGQAVRAVALQPFNFVLQGN